MDEAGRAGPAASVQGWLAELIGSLLQGLWQRRLQDARLALREEKRRLFDALLMLGAALALILGGWAGLLALVWLACPADLRVAALTLAVALSWIGAILLCLLGRRRL